jgi:AraC-like DNA-binding protein
MRQPPAEPDGPVRAWSQAPHPALRPWVRRFMVIEFSAGHGDAHLPDTSAVAAFSFGGACRGDGGEPVPPNAFSGLRETLRVHQHGAGHAVLLAKFTPAGAAALLRPPQAEFAGITADLRGELAPPAELERLHRCLAAAADHRQRVRLLEEFLFVRLRGRPDPLVAAAAALLEHGNLRIEALARRLELSQSALERRFRRVVGLPPKRFAALARLQRALVLRAAGADFTAAAHGAGYYDQPHFIHDFRRIAGTTPEAWFSRGHG